MKTEAETSRQAGYAFLKAVAKQVYLLFSAVGMAVALIISTVILVVFYYTLFTATALAGRLIGQKFLDRSFRKHAESYWTAKSGTESSGRRWERQF